MIKVNINLGDRGYPIYITSNYADIGRCFAGAKITGKIIVITDTNVEKHQLQEFTEHLAAAGYDAYRYVLPAGENSKNLEAVRDIYTFLSGLKLDRGATLVALGGGVVGDTAGFAAATFLRGIHFVQVPTTTLAQADSSVGGKVGVNFEGHKNIVGAFYQPSFVYINVSSLKTLPVREFQSGLAEMVKHGIIRDADFFDYIADNTKKIFAYDPDALQYLAKINCSIKGSVVEQDEKEQDLRAILNFGHTIGHAVESASDFAFLHGECVSIGMAGAFRLAVHLGMVGEETAAKVVKTLESIGLPVKWIGMDMEKVYEKMFYDKKIKNNKLQFILPKGIGEVVQCTVDDQELIKKVLTELA